MSYINKEALIADIAGHKQRVGVNNDFYQLAHDHIIQIVNLQNVYDDPEEFYIFGYRVKDLIIIAERLHKDKVDPQVLRADNEAFLEGYKHARDELQASIEKSIESIIGGANNSL